MRRMWKELLIVINILAFLCACAIITLNTALTETKSVQPAIQRDTGAEKVSCGYGGDRSRASCEKVIRHKHDDHSGVNGYKE